MCRGDCLSRNNSVYSSIFSSISRPSFSMLGRIRCKLECSPCLRLLQTFVRRKHQNTGNQQMGMAFVPAHRDPETRDIHLLEEFLNKVNKILVLTGAGLSTESGIPDYRSEGVGLYARTSHRPMQYQDFVKSAANRQRYWARNFVAWPKFSSAQPNISHVTLTQWYELGKLSGVVTQNVDALHTKTGLTDVIELHGCSHRVKCLSCHEMTHRTELQDVFTRLNPYLEIVDIPIAPDGDVLLDDEVVKGFQVPPCQSCGGVLIPDVVFFGDNVARPLVEKVYDMVTEADALLVAGSSLQVYSGYRFAAHASKHNIPIAVVNIGPTRADNLAQLKIDSVCGAILPQIDIKPTS